MDSATKDLFFQKINEYVHDEEKVVTCISIAADLKIPLNDTQSLLLSYVKDYRSLKPEELSVSHLLSGSLKDGKGVAVYLVKEEQLDQKKCFFDSISSDLIYSIQKSKNIDFGAIALVDAEPSHETFLGSIVGKNCIKRDLKVRKLYVPQQKAPVKENASFFKKLQTIGEEKSKPITQDNSKGLTQSQQKQPKRKPVGGIANFFSKVPPKSNENVKPEIEDCKVELQKTQNADVSPAPSTHCNNELTTKSSNEKMDLECEDSEAIVGELQDQRSCKKRKKTNKTSNMSNKKRKRIQEICDSDSDMFDDEEDESLIEKSDEEPEHPPLIKPVTVLKNKKRKAVDKTYMDEEGFIVTTTEYIYETASEDEEKKVLKLEMEKKELPKTKTEEKTKVLIEKKNSTTDSETDVKNSSSKGKRNKKPVNGKQPTLMSFFKKN